MRLANFFHKNSRRRAIKLCSALFGLLIIAACAPIQYVSTFQELTLPNKMLPYQESKIALASRVHTPEALNYSPIDSIALSNKYLSNKAVLQLKESLETTQGFDNLVFPSFNYYVESDTIHLLPLDSAGIVVLKESTDADYVIALDYIYASAEQSNVIVKDDAYGRKYYYAATQAPIFQCWRIYDMNKFEMVDQCVVSDTLVWDTASYDRFSALLNKIPSVEEAKILASISGANGYVKHIAPYWNSAYRVYYSDGTGDMETAAIYAEQSRWNEAMKLWLSMVKSTNKKKAGLAAFNMAVGTETLDDLTLSKEWLEESKGKNKHLNTVIPYYEKILNQRIQDRQRLDSLFIIEPQQ